MNEMVSKIQNWLEGIFASANGSARRPQLSQHRESNIPGLFVIGDLAGAPVIKLAMEHGVEVIEHIASRPDARATDPDAYDVVIVGAGAAGLNAALAAQEKGLRCVVLEKGKVANTIEDFPEGKWMYAEPTASPLKGKLWFEESTKEDLLSRWRQNIRENGIDVRSGDGLQAIIRHGDKHFTLKTEQGKEYRARRILLATGQRGAPRCLEVPGEEREQVYHRLYSPKQYQGENVLVVGGGNSAAEAAITLAEKNRVTLSYRGEKFVRLFPDNQRQLDEAVAAGRVKVIFNSSVSEFGEGEATLKVSLKARGPVLPVLSDAEGFNPREETGAQGSSGAKAPEVSNAADVGPEGPTYKAVEGDGFVGRGLSPGNTAAKTRGALAPEAETQTGMSAPPVNKSASQVSVGQAFLPAEAMATGGSVKIPYDHAFVLIGAEFPAEFLQSLGLRLENEWTGSLGQTAALTLATFLGLWVYGGNAAIEMVRLVPGWAGGLAAAAAFGALFWSGIKGSRWAWLGVSFFLFYSIFGIKFGAGEEFWPYRGWAYDLFIWFGRPISFWYGVLYTGAMTVFGFQAIKRWGFDRNGKKDKFQIWRYASLIGFQWSFMFLIPEFLFHWAVKYQWVGERLATDPGFAQNAWRSYGIVLAWPLFFYTFLDQPHMVWVVWGVLLTFVIIPVLVLWHGKRYCSWICTCGGLAETLGDRWRHLAPKGKTSLKWERMNIAILVAAVVITLFLFGKDAYSLLQQPADWGRAAYRLVADTWLVGILPLTLYPFLGGKIWCRYWCPLAKMMEWMSHLYVKLGVSGYGIRANNKCIACGECTLNCLVGIDVMNYAMKEETITNANSTCIGCGICVTVCPMDVLTFGAMEAKPLLVQISNTG